MLSPGHGCRVTKGRLAPDCRGSNVTLAIDCAPVGKLLGLSVPKFAYVENKNVISTYSIGYF